MATDGSCVVAWRGDVSTGTVADGASIQARPDDPAGSVLGARFQVNCAATGAQANPAVASDPGGGFLIVWDSPSPTGNDTATLSIHRQRSEKNRGPIARQFQVNSYTTGNLVGPSAATAPTGSSWSAGSARVRREGIRRSRASRRGVRRRRRSARRTSYPTSPAVAFDASGGFVVAWSRKGSPASDALSWSVQVRPFDNPEVPVADQVQMDSSTTGTRVVSEIGSASSGGFVLAWESDPAQNLGGSDPFLIARRYRSDVFSDGFEWSDALRWSLTAPQPKREDECRFLIPPALQPRSSPGDGLDHPSECECHQPVQRCRHELARGDRAKLRIHHGGRRVGGAIILLNLSSKGKRKEGACGFASRGTLSYRVPGGQS